MAYYAVSEIVHGRGPEGTYRVAPGELVAEGKFSTDELQALLDAGAVSDTSIPAGTPRELELQAQIEILKAELVDKEATLATAQGDLKALQAEKEKASVPKPTPPPAPKAEGAK